MADARTSLDEAARARVTLAVATAEKRTSAELVCAVATESGRYDRAEAIVGLGGALLGLTGLHLAHAPALGSWAPAEAVPLAWQAGVVAGGFALGNLLASHAHLLRRMCTSRGEMDEEVERAANHVFHTQRLGATRSRGGVLVYVSLFEREVVVLADQGAFAALGEPGVDAVRDLAVARLAAGDLPGALVAAIEALGDRLAASLPRAPDDTDELADAVLLIHPRP